MLNLLCVYFFNENKSVIHHLMYNIICTYTQKECEKDLLLLYNIRQCRVPFLAHLIAPIIRSVYKSIVLEIVTRVSFGSDPLK